MKQLAAYATDNNLPYTETEGGRHTKVKIGDKQTSVPRHREINELTAQAILEQIGVTK